MSNATPRSQLMAVAFGVDDDKDTALNRNTIRSEKLEAMAKKGAKQGATCAVPAAG